MYKICPECNLPLPERFTACAACATGLAGMASQPGTRLSGAIIESYQLKDFLGEGSMAWVYRAEHVDIGSSVAVKLLKPMFAEDEKLLSRFRKEAASISTLSHPNILSVISSGQTSSGVHYMVTEFINGVTLAQLIRQERRLSPDRAVDIMRQILVALEEAHNNGIIHRDLKPENVMVLPLRTGGDFCKLVDFGIALRRVPNEQRLTRHGEIVGTPEFMAPEIIQGEQATVRSDLYSAGVILYEMLTGKPPFHMGSMFEIMLSHLQKEPVPITRLRPELPSGLGEVVSRALEKDPSRRPGSASAMLGLLHSGEESEVVVCLTCGNENSISQKFCAECGRLQETAADTREMVRHSPNRQMFDIPFVGRKRELAFLRMFLQGPPSVVLVSGESGVGKRTLATRGLLTIVSSGMTLFQVHADPHRRPWWPLQELVRELHGLSDPPLEEELARACSESRLEPEEKELLGQIFFPTGNPDSGLEVRVRFRETVFAFARLIAGGRRRFPDGSFVIVFLDLDDMDHPSREVFNSLGRMVSITQMKMIGTTVATGSNHRQLRMERLDPAAAAEFCKVVLHHNGYEGLHASALVESAAGLPLHLVEGMRLMHEGISDSGRTLSDTVQLRFRNLNAPARKLLQWVALAGGRASERMFRESGLLEKVALDAVLTCVRHGFLAGVEAGSLSLAHPQMAQFLLAELSFKSRADMHRRLYEALRKDSRDAGVLAYHAMQAQMMEPAIHYSSRAGGQCMEKLDDSGALHHFRKARELAEINVRSGTGIARFLFVSLRTGDLLMRKNDFASAGNVLHEAVLYCTDDMPLAPLLLASLTRCLARTAPASVDGPLRRLLRMIGQVSQPMEQFWIVHDCARVLMGLKRYEPCLVHLQKGISLLAGSRLHPDRTWRLVLLSAVCEYHLGRFGAAEKTCGHLLEMLDKKENWLGRARVHEFLAWMHLQGNESAKARENLEKTVAFLRFVGDRESMVRCQLRMAELDGEAGQVWVESAGQLALSLGMEPPGPAYAWSRENPPGLE